MNGQVNILVESLPALVNSNLIAALFVETPTSNRAGVAMRRCTRKRRDLGPRDSAIPDRNCVQAEVI